MSKRYEELDSIRGLASLTVVFHHCLLTFAVLLAANSHESVNSSVVRLLTNSPFHIFFAGHEAVILFFVLSGFVLSLPFINNKVPIYKNYIIKRFCRIYLPYIFTIILSGTLFTLLKTNPVTNLSQWFVDMWSKPITIKTIISHLLMLGLDTHNLNTVTWSLVHEMRISIFFPLIMIPVLKYNWKRSLGIGLFTTYLVWFVFLATSFVIKSESLSSFIKSLGDTFYYSSFFVIGAIFATYKNKIKDYYEKQNLFPKVLMVVLGIFMYSVEWIVPGLGSLKANGGFQYLLFNTLINGFISIGVLILFTFALNATKFQKLLTNQWLINLGKISYSLYLIHIIVLLSLIYLLNKVLTVSVLVISVPFISLILATLMYKYVEYPSVLLGRKITKSIYKDKEKAA